MCNVRKFAHTRTYGRSLWVRVLRTLRIRAPRYPCPSSLNSVLETPYTQAHTRDDVVFLSALKRLLHNRLPSEQLRQYIPAFLPVLPIEKVGCPVTKTAPAGCSLRLPERHWASWASALRALRASYAHRRRSETRLLASCPRAISSRESPPPSLTSGRDAICLLYSILRIPTWCLTGLLRLLLEGNELPIGEH